MDQWIDMADYVESSLVRMEILVNAEPVDAFSTIVHRDKAEGKEGHFVQSRRSYQGNSSKTLQASVGGKVVPEKQSVP